MSSIDLNLLLVSRDFIKSVNAKAPTFLIFPKPNRTFLSPLVLDSMLKSISLELMSGCNIFIPNLLHSETAEDNLSELPE